MAQKTSAVQSRDSRSLHDALLLSLLAVAVFIASNFFDLFNRTLRWITQHESWQVDQLSTFSLFLLIAMVIYTARRHHELKREIRRREESESELQHLETQLRESIAEVETLTGLLPICGSCRKIRDAKGEWSHFETFIQTHTPARFTQGYCPECARKMYSLHARTVEGSVSRAMSEPARRSA
jgi:hypothetical protein